MKIISKKWGRPFAWFFMLLLTVATVASASDFGPRRWHRNRNRPPAPHSVVEPTAIALLGVGLVSLGIYAKKKRAKKQ